MRRIDYKDLPPYPLDRLTCGQRCQECGSFAITLRADERGECCVICKDCYRCIAHPDPDRAIAYFARPLMPLSALDRVAIEAAAFIAHRMQTEGLPAR